MFGKKKIAFGVYCQGSHKVVEAQENVLYDDAGCRRLSATWGLVEFRFTAIK